MPFSCRGHGVLEYGTMPRNLFTHKDPLSTTRKDHIHLPSPKPQFGSTSVYMLFRGSHDLQITEYQIIFKTAYYGVLDEPIDGSSSCGTSKLTTSGPLSRYFLHIA